MIHICIQDTYLHTSYIIAYMIQNYIRDLSFYNLYLFIYKNYTISFTKHYR